MRWWAVCASLGVAGAFAGAACSATPALVFDGADSSTTGPSDDGATVTPTPDGSNGGSDAQTPARDASTPTDAASDVVATQDAAPEASVDASGYLCGATTVADCAQCATAKFKCAATRTCVTDCKANCAATPLECIGCNGFGQPVAWSCETAATATACQASAQVGRCTCFGGVNQCPGARQICRQNQCLGCGENQTDNQTCQGGNNKKCDAPNYECN